MAESPMVNNADYIPDDERSNYSELQVLESGAGFYIGTIYHDKKTGVMEPGSRDSDYYPTRELAEEALKNNTWEQRLRP